LGANRTDLDPIAKNTFDYCLIHWHPKRLPAILIGINLFYEKNVAGGGLLPAAMGLPKIIASKPTHLDAG
jgi:hypothetical protein